MFQGLTAGWREKRPYKSGGAGLTASELRADSQSGGSQSGLCATCPFGNGSGKRQKLPFEERPPINIMFLIGLTVQRRKRGHRSPDENRQWLAFRQLCSRYCIRSLLLAGSRGRTTLSRATQPWARLSAGCLCLRERCSVGRSSLPTPRFRGVRN